jgi:hypothetical protein
LTIKGEKMAEQKDLKTQDISQTENFLAWRVEEPDGETTFHLDINNVTVHFFKEEWEEFLELMKPLVLKTK